MATLETSAITRGPKRLAPNENQLAPRLLAGLELLLDTLEYVQDLEVTLWDFAVEISNLRRLQVTHSDLRWLVGKGYIDHALEVTMPGDAQRSFRQPARLMFCKKTCFVLTPEGAELTRKYCQRETTHLPGHRRASAASSWYTIAATPEPLIPRWDRDRQELKVGSIVIKRFKVPAANQEAILAAFEEEGWPPRIDDPLSPHSEQTPKRRLQETIKSLNRNQKRSLIHFLGDGSGQGVRWEFRDGQQAALEP